MGLPELRSRGFEALVRELGVANALRYLHLHGMGIGDYTQDRDMWLAGLTIDQVAEEIRRMKLRGDIEGRVDDLQYLAGGQQTLAGAGRTAVPPRANSCHASWFRA